MVEKRKKKHRQNSKLKNHCPTSEVVSEVSERANEWAQRSLQAKRVVRNKWAVLVNEWMDEQVAHYFSLYSWLFWPTVKHGQEIENWATKDIMVISRNKSERECKWSFQCWWQMPGSKEIREEGWCFSTATTNDCLNFDGEKNCDWRLAAKRNHIGKMKTNILLLGCMTGGMV